MNLSTTPTPIIRQAEKSDAPEIARLLTVLGHPTTTEAVESRWEAWDNASQMTLVASEPEHTLAGVATLSTIVVLHRPKPVGRITALVVDVHQRGKGIGRSLVAAAEELLASTGCGILEITSNERLTDAHQFYEHLGYNRTSIRLAKNLET